MYYKKMLTVFLCLVLAISAFGQKPASKLEISPLTENFYVYTTYNYFQGNQIPANGLYFLTDRGAVIIDSPWDTTQFQPLLDSIKIKHNKAVVMCIATHFHEDRTGGLEYYTNKGIKTYTTRQTDKLSKKKGMKRAEFLMENDTTFTVGQFTFQVFYPGPGHAPDNIVIWFKNEKILYGGCLIKSTADRTLGNLGDANIKEYANTLKNVQRNCKNPEYIIPGHNDWTNNESLAHTLRMAEALRLKSTPD
jgi:glyoxylase-like metal-dependent hydrolase (beta-lactamase superfamily II)